MKYITIASHDPLKVAAILFSGQITHADMAAKWPLNKPIGAGFVTFHEGVPACVGFSTSLNLGPSEHDLQAVLMAMHVTNIQYPAARNGSADALSPAPQATIRELLGAAQLRG